MIHRLAVDVQISLRGDDPADVCSGLRLVKTQGQRDRQAGRVLIPFSHPKTRGRGGIAEAVVVSRQHIHIVGVNDRSTSNSHQGIRFGRGQ